MTIRESCKTEQDATFLKPSSDPVARLTISDGDNVKETAVRFHQNASEDFDASLDAYYLELAYEPLSLSTLASDGSQYSIQSIKSSGKDTIGLFMKSLDQTIEINAVKSTEMSSMCLSILDHLKFTIHPFETESSSLKLDSTGASRGRYSLLILDPQTVENIPCSIDSGVEDVASPQRVHDWTVFQNESSLIFGGIEAYSRVLVTDVLGRIMLQDEVNGGQLELPIGFSPGIYVVRLADGRSQKLFLQPW